MVRNSRFVHFYQLEAEAVPFGLERRDAARPTIHKRRRKVRRHRELKLQDDEISEGDLFRRHLEGDGAALEVLFERYETRIYIYCRRMLGSVEDAEDALQETFLRVTRQKEFRDDGFAPWLYRVACTVCRLMLKKRVSIREKERTCVETLETAPNPNPAEVYNRRVTEEEVSQSLDALPPVYRETLVLWYLEELTGPQIAEVLEVPLTTVEGRLRHGRRKLRQMLQRKDLE